MKTHSFKIVCDGRPLAPGVWNRADYPTIGDTVRVFDYPTISLFKVKRWRPRPDYWEHDPFAPVAIELEALGVEASGCISADSVRARPAEDLLHRLASVGDVAQANITESLHLNLCHSDFVALCDEAGLPRDLDIDLYAYQGMPLTVEEAGADWNACSMFGGFAWDMCCYWVTLPGGAPFVMNPTMLEIASAVAERHMSVAKASAWCQMAAQANTTTGRNALAYGFAEMLSLIEEEIMPVYDGAQELTRISLPSQAFQVDAFYEAARRRKGAANDIANDHLPDWLGGGAAS